MEQGSFVSHLTEKEKRKTLIANRCPLRIVKRRLSNPSNLFLLCKYLHLVEGNS